MSLSVTAATTLPPVAAPTESTTLLADLSARVDGAVSKIRSDAGLFWIGSSTFRKAVQHEAAAIKAVAEEMIKWGRSPDFVAIRVGELIPRLLDIRTWYEDGKSAFQTEKIIFREKEAGLAREMASASPSVVDETQRRKLFARDARSSLRVEEECEVTAHQIESQVAHDRYNGDSDPSGSFSSQIDRYVDVCGETHPREAARFEIFRALDE